MQNGLSIFLTSIVLLASNSALACPVFKNEYCCGPSLGVIQACTEKVTVEQTSIPGGMKYVFSGSEIVSGQYLADGQSHPFTGLYGSANATGDATTTCTDNAVIFESKNVTLTNGGVVAHGFYRGGVGIMSDGSIEPFENCSFADTDGTPIATTCGGGGIIAIGMACVPR